MRLGVNDRFGESRSVTPHTGGADRARREDILGDQGMSTRQKMEG